MTKTRIMVTGADGFIGHHFIEHLLVNRPQILVQALCSFRSGGVPERISDSQRISEGLRSGAVELLIADLRCPPSAQLRDKLGGVDVIVNFASRSHVDTSLAEPTVFFRDNVDIALAVFELAREVKPRLVVHISTDEVFGPAHGDHRHPEWGPLAPSNPYSASKAAQEAAAFTWWRAYNVPILVLNVMNNIGERQAAEKYIPMVISRTLKGQSVSVHALRKPGGGWRIGSRYYLHARNTADAVLFLIDHYFDSFPKYRFAEQERPPRFNVVGDVEVNNLELAEFIASVVGKPLKSSMLDAHSARPGHDLRYALDGTALSELGWEAPVPFWTSLERTIRWTLQHPHWLLE